MAKFSFSVTGTANDVFSEIEIADADAPRILRYLMTSEFGKVIESIVQGGEQVWVSRQATPQEAADAFARHCMSDLKTRTEENERQAAEAAARAAIPAIQVIE